MMPRSLIIIRVAREHGARNFVYTHLARIYRIYRMCSHGKEREEEKEKKKTDRRTEEAEEEEDEEEEEAEEKEKESARRVEDRGKERVMWARGGGLPCTVGSSRSSNSNGSATGEGREGER